MNGKEFYEKYKNSRVDADNAYGVQCVDAFILFCRENKIPYANTVTGWADGLWTHRKNYYSKYFDIVSVFNNLKDGDWIFTKNPAHVAMWYKGQMFSQNQNGKNDGFTLKPFKGVFLGAYRLKGQQESKKVGDNVTLQEAIKVIASEIRKGTFGNGHENRKNKIYELIRAEVNRK